MLLFCEFDSNLFPLITLRTYYIEIMLLYLLQSPIEKYIEIYVMSIQEMKNVAYFFFVCITYLVVSIKQFNSLYALRNMVLGKVKHNTRRRCSTIVQQSISRENFVKASNFFTENSIQVQLRNVLNSCSVEKFTLILAQCGNYGNLLSHFSAKNFVKVTFLLNKIQKR